MKTHIIYITLIAWTITLALAWQPTYKAGYLDGYRQQQIDSLPAVGVDMTKRPDPGLMVKG